jgi:hypothetical protein
MLNSQIFCFVAAMILFAIQLLADSPVDHFPSRYIDRPYTLPSGVHEFDFRVAGSFPLNPDVYTYYYINASYRQALSGDYTLLWDPLPLGIQYQPLHIN